MDKRKTGTSPTTGLLLATVLSAALAGCGGDAPTDGASQSTESAVRKIGTGTGSRFEEGAISTAADSVRAGSSVNVSVNVVDGDNRLITGAATVRFSSDCARRGDASFAVDGTSTSQVSTSGGVATITYSPEATGCEGDDTITAITTFDGEDEEASGTISVEGERRLGTGSGNAFTNGAIRATSSTVGAGGTTSLSVNIVDVDGNLVRDSVTVEFQSACSAVGDSSFTGDGAVTTTTGLAQVTYTASGCEGTDVVTATARLTSQTLTATTTLTVAGTRKLGNGQGSGFVESALDVPETSIRSGDSAIITANLVDGRGALSTDSATITFTSPCFVATKSAFSVNGNPTNSVTTTNGTASIIYTPSGCEGTDAITASTTLNGSSLTATGNVIVTATRRMGRETGNSFVNGQLLITSGTLSAGGTTSLSVNVVDGANALVTDPIDITFNSPCFANDLATFTSDDAATSTVTTSTGTARVEYNAVGCVGADVVTATATVLGNQLSATGTITVASPEIGSIDFDTAEPKDIAFSGSGTSDRPSKSTVTFRVVDKNGNGIRGRTVSFSLSTSVGGITLSSSSAVTNNDGFVSTTLNAGTVTTTVRVTASVTPDSGPTIFTTSDSINVNIGIADQNSFSLSLATFGPNAYNYDGVTVDVTARAADKNNNFVPDGTIINFVSSFGAIPGSCTTTSGACTVQWTSQGQRPADGMLTILARTVGEESYRDSTTDGRFDVAELASVEQLSDAFLDRDYDATRDNDEEYYDFGNDGGFTVADAIFNGSNCTTAATTAGHCPSLVEVRDDARLQMASDDLTITINNGNTITAGVPFNVTIEDALGNCPPTGTTITLSSPSGGSVVGKSSYVMPNIAQCQSARSFTFRVDATTPGVGGSIQVDIDTAGTSGRGQSYTRTASFN